MVIYQHSTISFFEDSELSSIVQHTYDIINSCEAKVFLNLSNKFYEVFYAADF